MLIARCAWHPRNHGHGKLLGVVSWRGLRLDVTDGICERCAARLAARPGRLPPPPPSRAPRSHTSKVVVLALAVTTGLILVARPTHDVSPPTELASALPRAVNVAQAPVSEPSAPVRVRRPSAGRPSLAPQRVSDARDQQSFRQSP